MIKRVFIFCVLFLGMVGNSIAYDGELIGVVNIVHAKANIKSQGLGLTLVGGPSLCGEGTPSMSYIDQEHLLYDAVLSIALTSSLAKKKVQLISNYVNDKCLIQQIRLYGDD